MIKLKLFFKILLSVIFILVLIIGGGIFYMTRGLAAGEKVAINTINPSSFSDGNYKGNYSNGRWTNEVQVTIKNGKIIVIDVVEDVTFPKPEWTKELLDKIIQKQSTEVDIVSGATVTSKAYIKSVEDALKK